MRKKIKSIDISIIVPVYNEQATIEKIYKQLKDIDLGVSKEVIFVDDASTDGSQEFLMQKAKRNPKNFKFYFHHKNRGKGAAVATAWEKLSGKYVIVQDADLEYQPSYIGRLIKYAKYNKSSVVYGSRNLKKGNKYSYWYLYYGGKLLSFLVNVFFAQSLTDVTTCYMLLRRDIAKKITITEEKFGLEIEITAKVSKMNVKIQEIPISYTPRTYKQGKKLRITDGLHSFFLIFKLKYFQ